MRFCKASQISQKTFKIESLFRKTVTSYARNCTKSLAFPCECIYVNILLHFLLFWKDQYLFNSQVLSLRRIKLLNNNVNKKKRKCKNLTTSEVMWHKKCRWWASIPTYPLCGFNKELNIWEIFKCYFKLFPNAIWSDRCFVYQIIINCSEAYSGICKTSMIELY